MRSSQRTIHSRSSGGIYVLQNASHTGAILNKPEGENTIEQVIEIIEEQFEAIEAQVNEDGCSQIEIARIAIDRLQAVFGV